MENDSQRKKSLIKVFHSTNDKKSHLLQNTAVGIFVNESKILKTKQAETYVTEFWLGLTC